MFGSKMSKVEKAIEKNNLKALLDLADAKDPEVRMAAIVGMGKVGGDDASNYLITQLRNPEAPVRIAVAQALGLLADMHTKAHVAAQLAKETDPEVRDAMSKAMGNIKDY